MFKHLLYIVTASLALIGGLFAAGVLGVPDNTMTKINGSPAVLAKKTVAKTLLSSDEQRIISFLKRDMTNNTQQGLADFMRKKLRFDESKRQYYLRACFWNQFVSLESTGSATEQQKAFKRELLLKKAGFAACGLALRQQQIDEARSNFGLIGSE